MIPIQASTVPLPIQSRCEYGYECECDDEYDDGGPFVVIGIGVVLCIILLESRIIINSIGIDTIVIGNKYHNSRGNVVVILALVLVLKK